MFLCGYSGLGGWETKKQSPFIGISVSPGSVSMQHTCAVPQTSYEGTGSSRAAVLDSCGNKNLNSWKATTDLNL